MALSLPLPPALRHRRYRLLWFGLLVSMTGSGMQTAAVLWHVNKLTGLPIALGGVGLVRILPVLAFSLVAGAAADAFNRRRLLFLTQGALAVLAACLGWLTLQGRDSLWLIYGIVAASGAIVAFDLPARQALVPNLLPRQILANAFSLNSIAFQVGSIGGPAFAGLVLSRLGIGYAYLVNAASFLAVIAALVLMGPVTQERQNAGGTQEGRLVLAGFVADVREGLRFVARQPIILSSMILDFFATFFSSATTLLPIFAEKILFVDAIGYGWLVAAPAIGSGAVALFLAFRKNIHRQGTTLLTSVLGFGLATIVFGVSRDFWLTFAALVATGATDGVSMIIRNTIRQLQTPDHLRGRMTSINQIFFMGGPQLGELEAGLVAQWLGAPFAVVSGGFGCLLAVLWVAARYSPLRRYDGSEPSPATPLPAAATAGDP